MDHKRETFADIVETLGRAEHEAGRGPIYSPLDSGEYVDADGVRWTPRGGELGWTRIKHLILDHEVRVVHSYLGEVREIPDAERPALLERIRPFLTGRRVPKSARYTDFRTREFKDDRHNSLLVVQEYC